MYAVKTLSTRERLRRAPNPPKRKPGTPKVHIDNLMRSYLKRLVAAAMPDYEQVRGQNLRLRELLKRVQMECAAGDEGDLAPVLEDIRKEIG